MKFNTKRTNILSFVKQFAHLSSFLGWTSKLTELRLDSYFQDDSRIWLHKTWDQKETTPQGSQSHDVSNMSDIHRGATPWRHVTSSAALKSIP